MPTMSPHELMPSARVATAPGKSMVTKLEKSSAWQEKAVIDAAAVNTDHLALAVDAARVGEGRPRNLEHLISAVLVQRPGILRAGRSISRPTTSPRELIEVANAAADAGGIGCVYWPWRMIHAKPSTPNVCPDLNSPTSVPFAPMPSVNVPVVAPGWS